MPPRKGSTRPDADTLAGDDIAARLQSHGLEVDPPRSAALAAFLALLEQWNRVHNLTGLRDRADLIDRHLVESLALVPLVSGSTAADIGSGGGLPGLPLAICMPGVRFTLIESRRKRVSFLRHVAATLGLANVSVAHGRVEDLELPEFDTVLARAVAPPAELLALARPLLAPGGRLVLLTSEARRAELIELATDLSAVDAAPAVAALGHRILVLQQ
jgi:16S rRNA (guanine527-N7)-methyltransferase